MTDAPVIEELVPASLGRHRIPRGDGPLLEVKGLRTSFFTRDGVVRAVDGIDFAVDRGEIMGLVGESGCGKSVTSLSIMRLVGKPGRIEGGSILFDGQDRGQLFNAPWLILAPGVALAMTVFGFNLLGDGIRDALDPRLNR